MEIPRPPQAVTFDCWSTLITDISWDETMAVRRKSLIEIAAAHGLDLDEERAVELIEGSWQEHIENWRMGVVFGPSGAARWVLEQLDFSGGSPEGIDHLAESFAAALEDATAEVGTQLVEGAVEAVQAVRAAGIPTALICDTGFTPARHIRIFLEDHGFELDHYFFSDEVGSPKPYRPIFEAALKATGADPSKSVHIGDLRRTDVAGARAAGMATIRFTGVHSDGWQTEESVGDEADVVLNHWSELRNVLGF